MNPNYDGNQEKKSAQITVPAEAIEEAKDWVDFHEM